MAARLRSSFLVGIALACSASRGHAQVPAGDPERFRIRHIEILTRDVFSAEEAERRMLYRFVNGLHVPTREGVVRAELWFDEGDRVSREQAEELERNLRASGLFASVAVELVEVDDPQGDEPVADLVVDTRDKLSVLFGGVGELAGGVGGYRAVLGETNLFGTGDSLILDLRESDLGERHVGISFTDRHFFDPRLRLKGSFGSTEEGDFFSLDLRRRMRHLEDPWSWGVLTGRLEDAVDYFASGETVAEVPRRASGSRAFVEHAWGGRDDRRSLGFSVAYDDTEYDPAVGEDSIDVPGDTRRLTVGSYFRRRDVTRRELVDHLDSLDFTEDVELGWWPELFVAGVARDEEGVSQHVEPYVRASVRTAGAPAPDTFVTLAVGGDLRTYAGDTQGSSFSGALHGYHFAARRHTLAASLAYDEALEREDLPAQLTLGEDNGLRGYPAREFSGTRRVRLNVEDRIDTGLEYRSVHLGVVLFADAGWVGGEAQSPDDVMTSIGCGLRLGSSELFGGGVLRIDLGFPLTDAPGVPSAPSLSLALGQVFTFFGNASLLPGR